jgi:hypothetical protein
MAQKQPLTPPVASDETPSTNQLLPHSTYDVANPTYIHTHSESTAYNSLPAEDLELRHLNDQYYNPQPYPQIQDATSVGLGLYHVSLNPTNIASFIRTLALTAQ